MINDTPAKPEFGVRWIKFSVRHKIYVLPDKKHTFEILEHGGFYHLTIAVQDKHGNRWPLLETKLDRRDSWTSRLLLAARANAAKVYGGTV